MAAEPTSPSARVTDESLPPCPVRHEFNSASGFYFCGHPQVHVANDLVSPSICRACTRWKEPIPTGVRPFPAKILLGRSGPCAFLGPMTGLRECPTCAGNVQLKVFRCDHHRHQETTFNECSTCYDYERSLSIGSVRNWAVGWLAGLDESPSSGSAWLAKAGFDPGKVRVFGCEFPLYTWSRFYLALAELYQRLPLADAFLLVREHIELCQDFRPYLEKTLWPAKSLGFVVLDGARDAENRAAPGFQELDGVNTPGEFGAIVFSNTSLRLCLGSLQAIDHRLRPEPASLGQIEVVLERWSRDYELKMFRHSPALARRLDSAEQEAAFDFNPLAPVRSGFEAGG